MPLPPAILQVLPALVSGGVERGTLEITEALVAAGYRALVASAGGPMVPELERLGGQHITLPLLTKSPWGMLANAARLGRALRQHDVALIHARSRAPAWSGLLAARRAGIPFVTTYHGAYNEGPPGKRFYNSVMARGDRVIAVSRFIAELVRERHHTDPALLRIIPRGVDIAQFDRARVAQDRIAALRQAWRLPEGKRVVLLPGRLSRWKGQDVLVRAMPGLPSDTVAVLLGGAEGRERFRSELEQLATEWRVSDRLIFTGRCDDMPAAFMLADVAVNPSTDPEAFGRTVVEAQAMGVPVIAADHGGARETVREAITGWRIRPNDAGALAGAIAHVLALAPEERAAVGQAARLGVLNSYTKEAMQKSTLSVYRELL